MKKRVANVQVEFRKGVGSSRVCVYSGTWWKVIESHELRRIDYGRCAPAVCANLCDIFINQQRGHGKKKILKKKNRKESEVARGIIKCPMSVPLRFQIFTECFFSPSLF